MDEELDAMQPVRRLRPHQRIHLTLRGHTAHDRQVVARPPLVHDGRAALGTVGLHHTRQEVETRFIHENKLPTLILRPLLQRGPRLDPPAFDRRFVPLDGPRDGDLRGPTQALQQAGDLALAVRDAGLLREDINDSATSPAIPPKAIRLGAVPEEVGDQPHLLRGQLRRRTPTAGARDRRVRPPTPGGGQPLADRRLGGVEGGRDVALLPTLSLEVQRPNSPTLPPVMRSRIRGFHTLIVGAEKLKLYFKRPGLEVAQRSGSGGSGVRRSPPCASLRPP